MRRDEWFFYFMLITFCVVFTADAVFDLGIADRINVPVELNSVSFSDVKPIFEHRCMQCHSDSHWNWTNYDVAFKNRDKIKFKVWTLRMMPPGGMPNDERLKIRDWVDGGGQR